jgi:hypothetical protein
MDTIVLKITLQRLIIEGVWCGSIFESLVKIRKEGCTARVAGRPKHTISSFLNCFVAILAMIALPRETSRSFFDLNFDILFHFFCIFFSFGNEQKFTANGSQKVGFTWKNARRRSIHTKQGRKREKRDLWTQSYFGVGLFAQLQP